MLPCLCQRASKVLVAETLNKKQSLTVMNNTLNTIKKLGQLADIIKDYDNLNVYDMAAIASLFNGGVDEALSALDEDNFYHGNTASIMVIDEADIEIYEVYDMVFEWYAQNIVDFRICLDDNEFYSKFQQFIKSGTETAIIREVAIKTLKNYLMLEYKNMGNYIADMETCINIIASKFLYVSKPLYTINLTKQGGKAFILMRSQTI